MKKKYLWKQGKALWNSTTMGNPKSYGAEGGEEILYSRIAPLSAEDTSFA